MVDGEGEVHNVPGWFWAGAVMALLWEAFGCFMYVSQVTTDPATLPIDQRTMWEASPSWMIAAYAIAVWVGLIGAVLLYFAYGIWNSKLGRGVTVAGHEPPPMDLPH